MSEAENLPISTPLGNMLTAIENAACNPDVDVEKMERLMAMAERMQDRAAEQDYNASLVQAQLAMPKVTEGGWNSDKRIAYSTLADVITQAGKVWTQHGFAMSYGEGESQLPDHVRVIADVAHQCGHTKRYHTDVPVVTQSTTGKTIFTLTHARASAITYGRRYLAYMIWNLATGNEDDDGHAAGGLSYEPISEEQGFKIDAYLQEHSLDRGRFMKWLAAAGIEKIELIPADQFDQAMRRLEKMNANS